MPKRRSGRAKKSAYDGQAKISTRYAFYLASAILFILIFLFPFLFYVGAIGEPVALAWSSIALSFLFPSIAFSFMLFRGKNMRSIVKDLGLARDRLTPKNIGIGIALFFAILLLSIFISLFSSITSIPLPSNVQQTLAGTPLYFLVFTFLIAPINEEIFFRGFLVPRIGVIASAIIFAILHLSYLSISEFAAAFVFGLLAGYVFKKRKSLYSSIIAHMLVNFITVISLVYVGSMLVKI